MAWDQVAIKTIMIGGDTRGYAGAVDDGVRFVLIDGVEVSTGTYRIWAVVHTFVLPALDLVLLTLTLVGTLAGRRRAEALPAADDDAQWRAPLQPAGTLDVG